MENPTPEKENIVEITLRLNIQEIYLDKKRD